MKYFVSFLKRTNEKKASLFSEMGTFDKKKSFSLYKQNSSYKKKKSKSLSRICVGGSYRTLQFVTVFTSDRQEAIFLLVTQFRYRTDNGRREKA